MKSVHLICYEGFSYEGWQRVFCLYEDKCVADLIFNSMMKYDLLDFSGLGSSVRDVGLYLGTGYGHNCLLVQSGESFTLEDFAECVRDATSLEVTYQDGEEDASQDS